MATRPSSDDLLKSYVQDCMLQGQAKNTIEKRSHVLKQFKEFIEGQRGKHLLDIAKEDIEAYIGYMRLDRGIAFQTLQLRLSNISTLYDYMEYRELIEYNLIPKVKKRYSKNYKTTRHTHKIITVPEMASLIRSAPDVRDKALMCLLAKTGIRRNELISLDVSDVDLTSQKVTLKPTAKRSNRVIFFDLECERLLRRWLRAREGRNKKNLSALFVGLRGDRLDYHGVDDIIKSHAQRQGLHNPQSENLEDHFTSHCFRHWLTTHLTLAGCPRHFIKEIRGDANRESMDVYVHVNHDQLKEAYLAYVPQLGL